MPLARHLPNRRAPWLVHAARAGAWLLLAAVCTAAGGCKARDGQRNRYQCRCPFLTDMDDASEQRVRVCARPESVEATAIGCAQAAAPAPIERCSCQPAAGACAADNECTALDR